jgi:hypothetical protein
MDFLKKILENTYSKYIIFAVALIFAILITFVDWDGEQKQTTTVIEDSTVVSESIDNSLAEDISK